MVLRHSGFDLRPHASGSRETIPPLRGGHQIAIGVEGKSVALAVAHSARARAISALESAAKLRTSDNKGTKPWQGRFSMEARLGAVRRFQCESGHRRSPKILDLAF